MSGCRRNTQLATIDDEELYNFKMLLDNSWGKNQYIGTIVVQSNPRGRGINSYYATSHEYCLNYAKNPLQIEIFNQPLTPEQEEQFKHSDDDSAYRLLPFRRSGGLSTPDERPNSEFPLYYNKKKNKIVAVGGERKYPYPSEYEPKSILILGEKNNLEEIEIENFSLDDIEIIMPIDTNGNRRVWRWSDRFKILQAAKNGDFIINNDNGKYSVMLKDRIKNGRKPKTMWYDSKYDASSHGTNILQKLFGERKTFGYPKSIHSTYDSIYCIVGEDTEAFILDYFAGSGTTGHAVINLNREDGGNRKYILVEMGNYFNTVTKPRIKKVIYAKDWKEGKPQNRNTGVSQIFKYIRLESYEDTLNNIELSRTPEQEKQLRMDASFFNDYLVSYMLDIESRGSLLNLNCFKEPFAYKMKIAENNETKETTIDLVETFNYLLGLAVTRQKAAARFNAVPDPKGEYENAVMLTEDKEGKYTFKTVEGIMPNGDKALVIWRNLTEDLTADNVALDAFFLKYRAESGCMEFSLIYVNGDNNLENLKSDKEQWKVHLIELEFKKRMFEGV